MLIVKQVSYNSSDYQEMLNLRNEVLRKPLGLQLDISKLSNEDSDYLIAGFEDEIMVGCLILSPQNATIVKLRQMAVKEVFQGHGFGRQIVAWAEAFAVNLGFASMEMHARKYAVPFYSKQGYECFGDEFLEVGIPHLKMKKFL